MKLNCLTSQQSALAPVPKIYRDREPKQKLCYIPLIERVGITLPYVKRLP